MATGLALKEVMIDEQALGIAALGTLRRPCDRRQEHAQMHIAPTRITRRSRTARFSRRFLACRPPVSALMRRATLLALVFVSCARTAGKQPSVVIDATPPTSMTMDVTVNDASLAEDTGPDVGSAPFTRNTMRVVERHSTSTAKALEMKSTVSITVESENGGATIASVEWPCWATLSDGRIQCVFGASYEQARIEKKNDTCSVVADFYGENTGEKKNVRKFGTFPCHDPLETRFEEAPGLLQSPH